MSKILISRPQKYADVLKNMKMLLFPAPNKFIRVIHLHLLIFQEIGVFLQLFNMHVCMKISQWPGLFTTQCRFKLIEKPIDYGLSK